VAWNEVVNDPGASRVEDNINIYLSSGTPDSPLRIHDNYIQGAYTIQPWQDSYSDGTYSYDWSYSGGGILLGDGDTKVADQASAYVWAYDNQVVSTTNYGIAIAAGHDNQLYNNRIISCGLLPDGRAIAAQNVGAYIWDEYGVGLGAFYNNGGYDNTIGWVQSEGTRNDWWVPDAAFWANNVHMPGLITLDTETTEYNSWLSKLADAGVVVGPTSPGQERSAKDVRADEAEICRWA
jgi:parallel beta-helix repeat protein